MKNKVSNGVLFVMNRDGLSLKELQYAKMVRFSKGRWVLNGKGNRYKQNGNNHPKKMKKGMFRWNKQ